MFDDFIDSSVPAGIEPEEPHTPQFNVATVETNVPDITPPAETENNNLNVAAGDIWDEDSVARGDANAYNTQTVEGDGDPDGITNVQIINEDTNIATEDSGTNMENMTPSDDVPDIQTDDDAAAFAPYGINNDASTDNVFFEAQTRDDNSEDPSNMWDVPDTSPFPAPAAPDPTLLYNAEYAINQVSGFAPMSPENPYITCTGECTGDTTDVPISYCGIPGWPECNPG